MRDLHRLGIDVEICRCFLNGLVEVEDKFGILEICPRQNLEGFLQTFELGSVTFRLGGKDIRRGYVQIELLLRCQAQPVKTRLAEKDQREGAKGFFAPDAERHQIVIVRAGVVGCHGSAF